MPRSKQERLCVPAALCVPCIAARDAANAGLAESRTVETQRGFSLFQSLLAGDVDFRSKVDRAELLDMAKKALDIVLDHSNGHPRADRQAKISWGSNGERRFTMDAGTDEATFARRLEDMIVRLSGLGPDADAIELRAAFRAVPRGERSRWIDALVRDGGDKTPYKVRTLCVALLQDAGVDDYASLSFPNRLPDAAATSLLRELASLPEGASAERARQCLDMARDLADDGRRANLAYVPATTAEAFNDEVVSAFVNTNERLFGQYRTLAADVLADVRSVFATAVVPADTTIRLFVTPEAVEGLARAQGGNRLAPEAMRDAIRAAAAEAAANRALAARVEARLAELNLPRQTPAATAVNALKSRNPDLVGRLAACRTPQDVAAVLDSVLDRMNAELRRASSVQTCRAKFGAMVRAELSARTGIPASARGGDALSRARISELASGVAHGLGRGNLPSDNPEQIEQAFRDVASPAPAAVGCRGFAARGQELSRGGLLRAVSGIRVGRGRVRGGRCRKHLDILQSAEKELGGQVVIGKHRHREGDSCAGLQVRGAGVVRIAEYIELELARNGIHFLDLNRN